MTTCETEYCRTRDHQELDRQLNNFLSSGGTIQRLPPGATGYDDGLYGSIGKHVRKQQARAKRRPIDDNEEI